MQPEQIIDIFREAVFLVINVVSVIVLPSLLIGLCISIVQAATQVNEQTLSFIPRLISTMVSVTLFGPWILQKIVSFSENIITGINGYVI